MKKVIAIMMTVAMAVMMFACSGAPAESSAPASDAAQSSAPAESSAAAESPDAAGEASPAADGGKIVIMSKQVGIPYFNAAEKGVKQAAEEFTDFEIVYAGPTKGDAAEQVKMIEDFISQGVSAIAVSANDAAALTPALTKAKAAGIVVLDWDTPADQSVVDLSVQMVSNQTLAISTWDELVKAMGTEEGEYVILTSTLTTESCNEWIKYGTEYAAEKYPNLKLVTDPIPTNESQQEAYTKTLDLLKTYPDLKGIIAFSSPAPLGAGQAVQEKGLQDKVSVVGTAMPNDSSQYLKDGSIDTVLLWDPAKLAYLAAVLARDLVLGNEITDGMEIPNVGQISKDGNVVIMGPPTLFTAENVDEYDF